MRGAAPASRLSHATAAVSPPCGSELAALVAAAVAPARDVGDGAVLVTFGGCSPEPPGVLFGDHDLEVPRSTPPPPFSCADGDPGVKLGCSGVEPVLACQGVKGMVHGCTGRGVFPGHVAMLPTARLTLRAWSARPSWSCVPAQVMQANVPLHEEGQFGSQGRMICNAWLAPKVQHARAGAVGGSRRQRSCLDSRHDKRHDARSARTPQRRRLQW